MRKILSYLLGVYSLVHTTFCFASEKFEILPDLPDPLATSGQSVNAATITNNSNLISQSVGHEPNILSVVFSLIIVVILIYITGIIYARLNKLGFNTLRNQQGGFAKCHANVISTTQLGNNKSLHVVELDGKRMLIGASAGAIQLIKDLGCVNNNEEEQEFSHIEIPNIKIPKIEIPKIEIPNIIKFSKKLNTESHASKGSEELSDVSINQNTEQEFFENAPQEVLIEELFTESLKKIDSEKENNEHVAIEEDYELHKKYL